MKTHRFSKIAMTFMVSALALMITLNNILDYGSNYVFVQHVLSMDDTFPNNALRYRAITSELGWNLVYWLIITGEGFTSLFFLMGSWTLWRARNDTGAAFNRAKRWIYIGAIIAMFIWFFCFMVIGGEYFLMWQSKTWNGQEAAFRFYMSVLGVLLYVNQTDSDQEISG
jgi:predicted small integral membrane protein